MGPDWLWVIVFSFGGLSMGMVTTFIGLPKGREVWGWLLLYAFMLAVVFFIDVHWPFWTVFSGSLASGLAVATVQALFMPRYTENNPWYEAELTKGRGRVAVTLYTFAIVAGTIFGVIVGGVAWALSAI